MALDNLIHIEITKEEQDKLNSFITGINKILEGKVVNLTPAERQQFGSIADKNKVLVDKCKDYMDNNPHTLPRTLDKAEFDADYEARKQIELPWRALNQIMEKLSDTKILLDHDNYQASVAYYRYVKYLSTQNEPGTTSIYHDLRKHYRTSSTFKSTSEDTTSTGEEASE